MEWRLSSHLSTFVLHLLKGSFATFYIYLTKLFVALGIIYYISYTEVSKRYSALKTKFSMYVYVFSKYEQEVCNADIHIWYSPWLLPEHLRALL